MQIKNDSNLGHYLKNDSNETRRKMMLKTELYDKMVEAVIYDSFFRSRLKFSVDSCRPIGLSCLPRW
jgi:hypothetical protein